MKLPAAAPDITDCANGAKIFANVLSGIKLFLHILAPHVSGTKLPLNALTCAVFASKNILPHDECKFIFLPAFISTSLSAVSMISFPCTLTLPLAAVIVISPVAALILISTKLGSFLSPAFISILLSHAILASPCP